MLGIKAPENRVRYTVTNVLSSIGVRWLGWSVTHEGNSVTRPMIVLFFMYNVYNNYVECAHLLCDYLSIGP